MWGKRVAVEMKVIGQFLVFSSLAAISPFNTWENFTAWIKV